MLINLNLKLVDKHQFKLHLFSPRHSSKRGSYFRQIPNFKVTKFSNLINKDLSKEQELQLLAIDNVNPHSVIQMLFKTHLSAKNMMNY